MSHKRRLKRLEGALPTDSAIYGADGKRLVRILLPTEDGTIDPDVRLMTRAEAAHHGRIYLPDSDDRSDVPPDPEEGTEPA